MRLPVTALALSLCLSVSAVAQKKAKPNTEEDADAAQQRTVAIALVSTLADEARSFKDQTRRARVQARAADVLWDSDPERASEFFRRAWEAAEIVDAEKHADEMRRMESEPSSRLQTQFMVVANNSNAEDFDLLAVFRHLARADLLRAIQLAKTFTGETPRAVATLAIARSVLEKRKDPA